METISTDQRISDILWHIEDAVRGTMPDASGSMLAAQRYEALSLILLGVLGVAAMWLVHKHLKGNSGIGYRTASGAALAGAFLFGWLALNPFHWAVAINPQIGMANHVISIAMQTAHGARP